MRPRSFKRMGSTRSPWMPSARNTVRAKPPINQKASRPLLASVGVTKPKIPTGAKPKMKLVILRMIS